MKIEVRNVKINTRFSRETICFTADVYINDIKAGHAENDGNGGNTFVDSLDDNKSRQAIKDAEDYCASLPEEKTDWGSYKKTLDSVIDDLVDAEVQKKFDKKVQNKIMKDYSKGFCIGVKGSNNYSIWSWKGHTIDSLLKFPKGVEFLKAELKKVEAQLKPGESVWNTNIDILK